MTIHMNANRLIKTVTENNDKTENIKQAKAFNIANIKLTTLDTNMQVEEDFQVPRNEQNATQKTKIVVQNRFGIFRN